MPDRSTSTRRRGGPLLAAALALVCLALAPAPALAAKGKPGVFGYMETRKEGLKAFPKWTGTLERYARERGKTEAEYKAWVAFLESVKTERTIRKLNKIVTTQV